MASSSMIAHRLRPSQFSTSSSVDGLPEPTWSTGLPLPDGLAPHPLVHSPAFLSNTPPPLISGLERHPDAPKPFTPSFFFRPPQIVNPPEPHFEDENLLSESSLFPVNESDSSAFFKAPDATTTATSFTTLSSTRSSRFLARSPSPPFPKNYASNPVPAAPFLEEEDSSSFLDLYPPPTTSSLSTGSSTESEDSNPSVLSEVAGDDAAYDGDDDRSYYAFRRSPLSPRSRKTHHQPPQLQVQVQVMPVVDASTAPSPHSQCGDSGFARSAFSEFTNYVAGGLSRLVSSATSTKSPVSATMPGPSLSRLLMEYLRASM